MSLLQKTPAMRGFGIFLVLLCAACAAPPDTGAEAKAALEGFYAAMGRGDAGAAMALIAPDAVFVESGRLETRAEYEQNHLPNDIAFERQVPGKRGEMQIKTDGDTAWIIQATEFDGTFEGIPIGLTSMQLAVLTREDSGWLIRSIHWSSQRR
jgi:ketosteroid isomerase-like protein